MAPLEVQERQRQRSPGRCPPDSPAARASSSITVTEHCVEELATNALFTSGTTGEPIVDGQRLVTGPRQEVADPASLGLDGTLVVAPEHRASFFVVRTLLAG